MKSNSYSSLNSACVEYGGRNVDGVGYACVEYGGGNIWDWCGPCPFVCGVWRGVDSVGLASLRVECDEVSFLESSRYKGWPFIASLWMKEQDDWKKPDVIFGGYYFLMTSIT
ncbi:hypothetical protein HNY73_006514 [Argiope bruennichi]|uniref:Uncharacterized protein n=1 Tax=Argiope bruennichi TaxID=94029 RepID=A0A8T0FGA0_ARGBR|nr:hypothetical protein HNY73_006514 [Argiope bruennichi]